MSISAPTVTSPTLHGTQRIALLVEASKTEAACHAYAVLLPDAVTWRPYGSRKHVDNLLLPHHHHTLCRHVFLPILSPSFAAIFLFPQHHYIPIYFLYVPLPFCTVLGS
jgi:hypothetical protein